MLLREHYGFDSFAGNREIGIEVEMEGISLPDRVSGWSVKTDGSLRGTAFEYVLPGPIARNAYVKALRTLYDTFSRYQIVPSNRCGVHVHLNVRELEMEQIFNFIVLYLILEDVLLKWCGDNREGNLFCLRAKDAEWMIHQLIQDKNKGYPHSVTNAAAFKYGSLNLSALANYGSLEFRGLGTTDNCQPILDWIEILLTIKDYAVTVTRPESLIDDVCALTPKVYIKRVLGPELYKLVKCPNIENIILDAARRVQAIAYTPLGVIKKKDPSNWLNFNNNTVANMPEGVGGITIQPGAIPRWRLPPRPNPFIDGNGQFIAHPAPESDRLIWDEINRRWMTNAQFPPTPEAPVEFEPELFPEDEDNDEGN